jgi:hypothetical protein
MVFVGVLFSLGRVDAQSPNSTLTDLNNEFKANNCQRVARILFENSDSNKTFAILDSLTKEQKDFVIKCISESTRSHQSLLPPQNTMMKTKSLNKTTKGKGSINASKPLTNYVNARELRFAASRMMNHFDETSVTRDFFHALGITSWMPMHDERDLSEHFPSSPLQKTTLSCVGHAVASEVEHEIYKLTNEVVSISGWYAYQVLQMYTERNLSPDIALETYDKQGDISLDFQADHAVDLSGSVYMPFKSNALAYTSEFPEDIASINAYEPVAPTHYRIQESVELMTPNAQGINLDTPFNYDFFRIMIDHQKAPVVWISSESRMFHGEDWYEPLYGGGFSHMVVVVGYGVDEDPKDGKEKPYLLVRDSLVNKPIHYKVSAEEFVPLIIKVFKIVQVATSN